MSRNNIFESSAIKIGKYYWRVIVINSTVVKGQKATLYQFSYTDNGDWHDQHDWHKYNFNDSYLGLPKSLSKLYYQNKAELQRHIPEIK